MLQYAPWRCSKDGEQPNTLVNTYNKTINSKLDKNYKYNILKVVTVDEIIISVEAIDYNK